MLTKTENNLNYLKKNLQNVNPPEFWSANVPNVREHTMAILNDITMGHTALLTRKICQIMLSCKRRFSTYQLA